MRKLLFRLSQSAAARNFGRSLRLMKLGNWWLRTFPLTKRLPESGVIYRARSLESIPLAVEMFEKNLYDASLLPADFSTFADLGCNVGYFSCWLAHLAQGRPLKGLMIDANLHAVAEARWHAQANSWTEVHALNGVLGEHSEKGFVDFYLYESNICSTTSVEQMQSLGLKGEWKKIEVPCLTLSTEWRNRFGPERCHLLKIDIEGSEMRFLHAEAGFLLDVDAVLVEWHKWSVTFEDIHTLLVKQGFNLTRILDDGADMGTAFFRRTVPLA